MIDGGQLCATAWQCACGNSIVGALQMDLFGLSDCFCEALLHLYSLSKRMVNQTNRFILRHFYIVKGKGPVKTLKLTAVYTIPKAFLKAACRTGWQFIIMEQFH